MGGKKKSKNPINQRFNRNIGVFVLTMLIVSFVILISIPMILEYLIYRNGFVSALSNSEWSGFLGSFLGSIIGAIIAGIVTIYGIKLTIEHNTEIVTQERSLQDVKEYNKEIKLNRPYMYINFKGSGGGLQNIAFLGGNHKNISRYSLELVNVGMNTALNMTCNIDYYDFNGNIIKKDLFNNKKIIKKGDLFQFELGVPRDGKKYKMFINFQDLLENNYEQEISFEYLDGKINFSSYTPVIKNI